MFPPVENADEYGLLCYGGELNTPTLLEAYRSGIFPWPHEGYPMLWFAPPERGVFFCEDLCLSRRARRALRSSGFTFKIDHDFDGVIRGCGGPRKYSDGTWVNEELIEAYTELFRLGLIHTVETYRGDELVGGLYGLSVGRYFCGESMFHTVTDASKAALVFLLDYVHERGATWIDCQLTNPFFDSLGGTEIPRPVFMHMLEEAWNHPSSLFPD